MLRNYIIIYFRLFLIMVLALLTSRYVFKNLGTNDYGIYSVVGGVVVLLAFLNNAMVATTQRFLSYNLSNNDKVIEVFNISKTIHLALAIIILFFGESIGLYFVNTYLNFEESRSLAVNIAYQSSLFSMIAMTVNVPYLSIILVNQKISFYALVGVAQSILKLALAVSLSYFFVDKLIAYSILLLLITVLIYTAYYFYALKNFVFLKKTEYIKSINQLKEMLTFSSWNLIGVLAGLGQNVGVNILLNIFFNPAINSSRALSLQVYNAFNNINSSAQTVYAPVLIKKYAENEKDLLPYFYLFSKVGFFIILLLLVPTYYYLSTLLKIWLDFIPPFLITFMKILMFDLLIVSFTGPLHTLIQANGDIKIYQIIVSGILLLNIPIGIILFKMGFPPQSILYVSVCLNIIALLTRVTILKLKNIINVSQYIFKVGLPIITILSLSLLIYILPISILMKSISTNLIIVISILVTFLIDNDNKRVLKVIKAKLK